jgi:hypothetical protein
MRSPRALKYELSIEMDAVVRFLVAVCSWPLRMACFMSYVTVSRVLEEASLQHWKTGFKFKGALFRTFLRLEFGIARGGGGVHCLTQPFPAVLR